MTAGWRNRVRTMAALGAMVACLAAIFPLARWTLSFWRPIPGEARPGHPATVTAHRGDTLRLAPKTDDHSARCTVRPTAGVERTFLVYPLGDEGDGGLIDTIWWDGTAQLDCDRRVDGSVGPPYAPWLIVGTGVGILILVLLAAAFGLRAYGAATADP